MIKKIIKLGCISFLIHNCESNSATKGINTLENKKGEFFTFHGYGTVTVKGPFNEDLGTHRTNINDPEKNSEVQLIKKKDNSVVYVGHIGLNGGMFGFLKSIVSLGTDLPIDDLLDIGKFIPIKIPTI
ncbi:MAG: hypothetical protein GY830_06335 [Bacteroidetes bacterium]|nr:hypothetical protein [Bacteroidota bacterium]